MKHVEKENLGGYVLCGIFSVLREECTMCEENGCKIKKRKTLRNPAIVERSL